ncbi:hypothetical protein MRX96_048944 [Rhipicephalus microplus]
MDPRDMVHPETGTTVRAAELHRKPTQTASKQPRLAGKLRRGKSPEVTFYKDELSRHAQEYATKGGLENEACAVKPKHTSGRPVNRKADPASPTVYSKAKQARYERTTAGRTKTDPSFVNYYPGWQPYRIECPPRKRRNGQMSQGLQPYVACPEADVLLQLG